MSQHQKGYSYFVGVACSEGMESKRGKWSGKRQLTQTGARLAGRREEERGQQVQVVQVAVGKLKVHVPTGTGSWPCAGSTRKGSENKWTTLFAPREVGSGAALTPFLSQTETPVPAPCLLLLLPTTGELVCTKNCLGQMQTLISSLGHEYKTLPPHFLGQDRETH